MSLDPVTQEVLSHAFAGIAEEMAVVEYRSSFSPIIREMLDFSCGLFDAEGRMIAHSEMIPAQLGLMQFALTSALGRHGRLAPGDPGLADIERRLAAQPAIMTPAITLDGDADGVIRSSGTAGHARHFTGPHEHRVVPGGGHNLPQERPETFAAAVLDVRAGRLPPADC